MTIDTNRILNYWFADSVDSNEAYVARKELWFMNSESFDMEIKSKFEPCIELAANRTNPRLEETPRDLLALIVILDQFPRNVYRGTPKAFAYDSEALRLTQKMIDTGMLTQLKFVEKFFAYMPLQHGEEMWIQDLSIRMFGQLKNFAEDPVHKTGAEQSLEYAILHREIIERFGRFPHRNEILGRESTNEELEYLASGAETFGQTKR